MRDGDHAPAAAADSRRGAAAWSQFLKPGGTLYLSWRVTEGPPTSAIRTAGLFRVRERRGPEALDGIAAILLDDEPVSASSGKTIHRIVARRT